HAPDAALDQARVGQETYADNAAGDGTAGQVGEVAGGAKGEVNGVDSPRDGARIGQAGAARRVEGNADLTAVDLTLVDDVPVGHGVGIDPVSYGRGRPDIGVGPEGERARVDTCRQREGGGLRAVETRGLRACL